MMLNIHENIKARLQYFKSIYKIPNIIFHGPSGSGKRTIVNDFIYSIYNNNRKIIKSFVMSINCAHGKGIKFVRDELKFFAKTHIHSEGGNVFKSIILLNADKLTMDAQSALRRCIELFSHNTRFFMVVENKYKLLKPILSRFCEIYVPMPIINGNPVNIYKHNLSTNFDLVGDAKLRSSWLKKELNKCIHKNVQVDELLQLSIKLYEKGYSGLDVIQTCETAKFIESIMSTSQKYKLLLIFDRVKYEFRNEKLLILFILNFVFLNNTYVVDNNSVSKMLTVI
jgi:hypothetical protein